MKKLIALAALVLLFGAGYVWYRQALGPVDPFKDDRRTVTVEKGLSTEGIAALLYEEGLIRSPFAFKLYVRLSGSQSGLQAGSFVLRPSLSTAEIVETLASGKAEEMIVTIPEGFTVKDIDALLASKGLIEAGEIIRCARECNFPSYDFLPKTQGLAQRGGQLEGYLYPDTYFVLSAEFVPQYFLERLLTTFRTRVVDGMSAEIAASGKSLDQIVTMASLIEKETRKPDERPMVAGILWNRFDIGMRLDVDATVRYITNKDTEPLTVTDLAVDSPYNTRKEAGLPPGPIASPSLGSIRAAISPEQTSYWFYLHGSDGQIRYAETNDQHNANKARYL